MANEPIAPPNTSITSGLRKNTLTWDYFPNEYFDDLDNWTVSSKSGGVEETATIVDGKVRMHIPDGDGWVILTSNKVLPSGSFVLDVNVSNYTPESASDGLSLYPGIINNITNYFIVAHTPHNNGIRIIYVINGGTQQWGTLYYLSGTAERIRIVRDGTVLKGYAYESNTWTFAGQIDFGIYSEELIHSRLYLADRNDRGGSVDFDNLIIVPSENCFPNEYFDDSNRWNLELTTGGGTAEVDSGKVLLDVPDNQDASVRIDYNYPILLGDFTYDIDLGDYQKDAAAGPVVQFILDSLIGTTYGRNHAFIRIYDNAGTWRINYYYKINGSTGGIGYVNIAGKPSKLRIIRDGNFLKTYYYISSWILVGSIDFGAYASEINIIKLSLADLSLHGGSVEFDNLVLVDRGTESYNLYWDTTSGVTKDTGTKIADVTSAYEHYPITSLVPYYYVITAENSYGEGDESEELSGTPTAPPPTIWKSTGNLVGDTTSDLAIRVRCFVRVSNGEIFAGTDPYADIYKSIDNGLTWTNTANITIGDSTSENVYCLTTAWDSTGEDANEIILAGVDNYVYKSVNLGASWIEIYDSTGENVYCILQTSDDSILIGVENQIYKSVDYGESWVLTGFSYDCNKINGLYQIDNSTIYVVTSGTYGYVFKSIDNGDTWTN